MTATGDVRAQLTGPGGPFEVVTEVVNGIEMKVYKDRMPSLREVPKAAINRGDQDFLVFGDKRWSYADFVRQANGVAHALARDAGVGHGDRVAVLSANNPEWCMAFWATVDLGAILVGLNGWWKTDEILYGLARQRVEGPGGRRQALRAHRRPARPGCPASSTST